MTSEMTMKHTLGPWEWRRNGAAIFLSPGVLVTCFSEGTPWGDELDQANARLIAAAPGLLVALNVAENLLMQTLNWKNGWECSEDDLLGGIRAAIAKAEGRS